jgi:hypothetical protein
MTRSRMLSGEPSFLSTFKNRPMLTTTCTGRCRWCRLSPHSRRGCRLRHDQNLHGHPHVRLRLRLRLLSVPLAHARSLLPPRQRHRRCRRHRWSQRLDLRWSFGRCYQLYSLHWGEAVFGCGGWYCWWQESKHYLTRTKIVGGSPGQETICLSRHGYRGRAEG